MKKHMKKILLSTMVIAGCTSLSVAASPVLEKVSAYINKGITYTLNGETVLEGKGGLVYQDSVYVPLRAVAEVLDVEVNYDNGQISLVQKTSDDANVLENGIIECATVMDINADTMQLTILPNGLEDVVENYVIINMSEETAVQHEKTKAIYTFADIEKGMSVKVEHAPLMTMSIPAQTPGVAVTILGEAPEMAEAVLVDESEAVEDQEYLLEIEDLDLIQQAIEKAIE